VPVAARVGAAQVISCGHHLHFFAVLADKNFKYVFRRASFRRSVRPDDDGFIAVQNSRKEFGKEPKGSARSPFIHEDGAFLMASTSTSQAATQAGANEGRLQCRDEAKAIPPPRPISPRS